MEKALVVYETWTGATRQVAEAVAEVLGEGGAAVEVRRAREVKDVGPYDALVIGVSVHAGQVPRGLRKFVRRHKRALGELPVAMFVVCYTMNEWTEENCETARGYLKPLYAAAPQMEPVGEVGLFGGVVLTDTPEYKKLFPLMKVPLGGMAESEGDHRDWDAIRAWASEVRGKLG